MEMLIDVFTDAALDCIKMLPFLFLAFLLIEALEHYSSDFTKKLMIKVDKAGPVVGAVVGCVHSVDSRLWQPIYILEGLLRSEH